MSLESMILETLKNEVKPAMGCTEPVAIALAVAKARELCRLNGEDTSMLKAITIKLSPNVFKNGLAVGIPGTDEIGLTMATALGFTSCDATLGLKIFKHIDTQEVAKAKALIEKSKIKIQLKDTEEKIHIEVHMVSHHHESHVIIQKRHDLFVYLADKEQTYLDKVDLPCDISEDALLYQSPIHEVIETVLQMPHKDLLFLIEGIHMNEKIASYGLSTSKGMGVGYALKQKINEGILGNDLMNYAMALTSAASDARMSGVSLPVMSSNGSGNNGLTALLPIAAYAHFNQVSDEQLAKAAALSHIINSIIKHRIGRLSALCGCGVAAGTGASVALAWLMGANLKTLEAAIQNMIANTTGMICDGAKVGCALKLATSASASVQSALLAVSGISVPAGNGIIGTSADKSLENLSYLSKEAMPTVDRVLMEVMIPQFDTV